MKEHHHSARRKAVDSLMNRPTPRELELAERNASGFTNKEIAGSLFISEAAVKKHLNAICKRRA